MSALPDLSRILSRAAAKGLTNHRQLRPSRSALRSVLETLDSCVLPREVTVRSATETRAVFHVKNRILHALKPEQPNIPFDDTDAALALIFKWIADASRDVVEIDQHAVHLNPEDTRSGIPVQHLLDLLEPENATDFEVIAISFGDTPWQFSELFSDTAYDAAETAEALRANFGWLTPEDFLVFPASGRMGIALSGVCAAVIQTREGTAMNVDAEALKAAIANLVGS